MAVLSSSAEVEISLEGALAACQQAVVSFGWKVTALGKSSITVIDRDQGLGMNPVTITVEFTPMNDGTHLELVSHIRGIWGGDKHMQGRMGQLINAISVAAKSPSTGPVQATSSVAGDLKALMEMRIGGLLTDEEFAAAKAKILS
jgi:hypothetical protein